MIEDVLDIDAQLTADYKAAVTATLPIDKICPTAEFWRSLTNAVAFYFVITNNRRQRPPRRELERWRKFAAQAHKWGRELENVSRHLLWRDRSEAELSTLRPIEDYAKAHVVAYETLADRTLSHGRGKPAAILCGDVLDLWQRLGMELRYSRSGGVPGGPLIRFVFATVGPVLGDAMPTVYGIAAIIDRRKGRRPHTTLGVRK